MRRRAVGEERRAQRLVKNRVRVTIRVKVRIRLRVRDRLRVARSTSSCGRDIGRYGEI